MIERYKKQARAVEWWLAHRMLLIFGRALFRFKGRKDQEGPIDLSGIRSVLVVRLDEIGDLVLTIPFLRELRRNLPNASITLLVKPELSNLFELCPYLDEVITHAPFASRYWRSLQATTRAASLSRRRLWPRDFDLAIAPRWDVDSSYSSMVTFLSGSSRRVAYSEEVTDEKRNANPGLDRLFTHVCARVEPRHEVEKNLDLIQFIGGQVADDHLDLWIAEADESFAASFLEEHGIPDDAVLLAVAPGAGHPRRRWPLANYVEIAAWFQKNFKGFVIVVGGQKERALGRALAPGSKSAIINVTGETSLRQAAALLKRSTLFVGNDAGPMHLAAAVGLPVLEISCHPLKGSQTHVNSPARFGPWHVPQIILRPNAVLPCTDSCVSDASHCVAGVSVEQVKEALAELLSADTSGLSNHDLPLGSKILKSKIADTTWPKVFLSS